MVVIVVIREMGAGDKRIKMAGWYAQNKCEVADALTRVTIGQ